MITKIILSSIFICLLLLSCTEKKLSKPYEEINSETKTLAQTILGKQLENPYTVENMQKAYKTLTEKKQLKSSITIEATHYYVRFFPVSNEQLEELESDSLFLFDYPLDFEIEEIGDYYIDPEVNPEDGQWYYTSVPVDYKFRNIKYEIIANLFIPETEPEFETESQLLKTTNDISFLCELEDEALKLTNNYTLPEVNIKSTLKHSKKTPHGYVYVYDSERNDSVPVEGVRVRTRRWFSYGRDYTDENGYYKVDRKYRRDVHYCLFFENKIGFKIRADLMSLWKAKHHVGKHNRNGYDFYISENSRAWPFCTVNNAVVKYFNYCDQFKIDKPHCNLRLVAQNKEGSSATPMLKHNWGSYGFSSKSSVIRFLGKMAWLPASELGNTFFKLVLPDIIVKAKSSQGTAKVYETCFHELGHASHYKKVGCAYWTRYINYIATYGSYGDGNGNDAGLCALGETWGYHIGYKLTLEEFKNAGTTTDNSHVSQSAFEDFNPKETGRSKDDISNREHLRSYWYGWIPAGIINDIIDNQVDLIRSETTNSIITNYYDNVSGYTHEKVFNALDKDIDTPLKFRDNLLEENDNLDSIDLVKLFEAYYYN